jgi:hypothetical protein
LNPGGNGGVFIRAKLDKRGQIRERAKGSLGAPHQERNILLLLTCHHDRSTGAVLTFDRPVCTPFATIGLGSS